MLRINKDIIAIILVLISVLAHVEGAALGAQHIDYALRPPMAFTSQGQRNVRALETVYLNINKAVDGLHVATRLRLKSGIEVWIGIPNRAGIIKILIGPDLYQLDLHNRKLSLINKGHDSLSAGLLKVKIEKRLAQGDTVVIAVMLRRIFGFTKIKKIELKASDPLRHKGGGFLRFKWLDSEFTRRRPLNFELGFMLYDGNTELEAYGTDGEKAFISGSIEPGPCVTIETAFLDRFSFGDTQHFTDLRSLSVFSNFIDSISQNTASDVAIKIYDITNIETLRLIRDRLQEVLCIKEWEDIGGSLDYSDVFNLPWVRIRRSIILQKSDKLEVFKQQIEECIPKTLFGRILARAGYGEIHIVWDELWRTRFAKLLSFMCKKIDSPRASRNNHIDTAL